MQHAIEGALRAHWRLFVIQGVVLLACGIVAIVLPVAATIAVDVFVGWLFLFSGIAGLVALLASRNIPAFFWTLLTAALSITVGILLVWKPAQGAVSLTLVLTAFLVVEGVLQSVSSVAYREAIGRSWGWMLTSGIADLALAAIIILGWPLTAAWSLGLLVGINLISSGWAILAAGLAGRKLAKGIGTAIPAAAR